jgi:transposase
VVNLYAELGSYRAVAEVVGCDHKTVKAHLDRVAADGPGAATRRRRLADPFTAMLRLKLESTSGRISAKRLYRILVAAGYMGSARTLRRAVAELRVEWRRQQHRRVYRPWQSAPGDVLIVDWGHVGTVVTSAGRRPLYAFCAVLGWSRYRFVRFTTSQRFAVLASCLASCFEHLGGVPARVMFDNPKTVTTDLVAGQSVLNPDLVRLASYYGFLPVTAAVADPESKGKVEAVVRFVETDLVPEEGFVSLDVANQAATTWMDDVNAEAHPEIAAVPTERLIAERAVLRPLRERPALATGEPRRVDKCSTIRVASARYSVPYRLVGEWVVVDSDGDVVRVFANGCEVAVHQAQSPGGMSIDDRHYPTPPPTGVRALRPVSATERAFVALGPAAEAFLRGAATAGASRLPRTLGEVLELTRSHGTEAVVTALQRALAFRRFGADDLRAILAAGAAVPPTQLWVAAPLVIPDAPAVPTRSLEAYAWPA